MYYAACTVYNKLTVLTSKGESINYSAFKTWNAHSVIHSLKEAPEVNGTLYIHT